VVRLDSAELVEGRRIYFILPPPSKQLKLDIDLDCCEPPIVWVSTGRIISAWLFL